MSRNDDFELDDCLIVKRLPASFIVQYEGEEIQVPYSLVRASGDLDEDSEPDESGSLVVPLWLAEVRGVA